MYSLMHRTGALSNLFDDQDEYIYVSNDNDCIVHHYPIDRLAKVNKSLSMISNKISRPVNRRIRSFSSIAWEDYYVYENFNQPFKYIGQRNQLPLSSNIMTEVVLPCQ